MSDGIGCGKSLRLSGEYSENWAKETHCSKVLRSEIRASVEAETAQEGRWPVILAKFTVDWPFPIDGREKLAKLARNWRDRNMIV